MYVVYLRLEQYMLVLRCIDPDPVNRQVAIAICAMWRAKACVRAARTYISYCDEVEVVDAALAWWLGW